MLLSGSWSRGPISSLCQQQQQQEQQQQPRPHYVSITIMSHYRSLSISSCTDSLQIFIFIFISLQRWQRLVRCDSIFKENNAEFWLRAPDRLQAILTRVYSGLEVWNRRLLLHTSSHNRHSTAAYITRLLYCDSTLTYYLLLMDFVSIGFSVVHICEEVVWSVLE